MNQSAFMFNGLVLKIIFLIKGYGSLAVFGASFLEQIFAPIPSILILTSAGFVFLSSSLSFLDVLASAITKIALPGALGMTLGSLFLYFLAYFGGKPIISKWGKWFGLSWEKIEKVEKKIIKGHYDELVILGLRAVPFIPISVISAVCGLFRYPLKNYLFATFLGSFIRALFLGILGWSVGSAYHIYAKTFSHGQRYFILGFVILIIITCIYFYLRRKKSNKSLSQ